MDFDAGFAAASQAAMLGWLALILLPRWRLLVAALRYGVVGLLALGYAALVFAWFFRVEGGGFASIAEVRTLFLSDPVLLAGWIHYLAFDLLIGVWEVRTARREGIAFLLVLPCLVLTFLFGPAGFLVFSALRAARLVQRGVAEAAVR